MMVAKLFLVMVLQALAICAQPQVITTIAGTPGRSGSSGDGGAAVNALLSRPFSLAIDNNGQLLIGDWHNRIIRKVSLSGVISPFAGNYSGGYSGDNGSAIKAKINTPYDIAVGPDGIVYFVDLGNEVIRSIDKQGIIRTVAGTGRAGNGEPFIGDGGPATAAPLFDVTSLAVAPTGEIYFTETAKNSIRMVDRQGIIHTICGQGMRAPGYNGDGGLAMRATLYNPMGIAVDKNGNIFVADLSNHVIRRINSAGIVSTIAGNGQLGYSGDGGPATAARLNRPFGIAIDDAGNLFISEEENHVIRKITTAGVISTIAGTGDEGYSGDGGPAVKARLSLPHRLAIDRDGTIYIADTNNHTVRKIVGCTGSFSSITISTQDLPACPGDVISFAAQTVNGGTNPAYQWMINEDKAGTNQPFFQPPQLSNGATIRCLMKSSNACSDTVVSNIISVDFLPAPTISLPASVRLMPGSSVQLTPTISGSIADVQWTPAIGLSNPAVLTPFASPQTTTRYQLDVTHPSGCKDTASINVVIYQRLFLPTAFTPNGDGKNDFFGLPSTASFLLNRLTIYNRWGEIVFTSTDRNTQWDGRYKGTSAPAGVYGVMVKGYDLDEEIIVKGTVLLIR